MKPLRSRSRRLLPRRALPPPGQTPRQAESLVAVARSILVIVWHLLSGPIARFYDLGPDCHTHRIDTTRKIQNHFSGLTAWAFASPSNPPPDTPTGRLTPAVVPLARPGSASGHAEPVVPFARSRLIFRSGQLVDQAGAGDHDGPVFRRARRSGQIR